MRDYGDSENRVNVAACREASGNRWESSAALSIGKCKISNQIKRPQKTQAQSWQRRGALRALQAWEPRPCAASAIRSTLYIYIYNMILSFIKLNMMKWNTLHMDQKKRNHVIPSRTSIYSSQVSSRVITCSHATKQPRCVCVCVCVCVITVTGTE